MLHIKSWQVVCKFKNKAQMITNIDGLDEIIEILLEKEILFIGEDILITWEDIIEILTKIKDKNTTLIKSENEIHFIYRNIHYFTGNKYNTDGYLGLVICLSPNYDILNTSLFFHGKGTYSLIKEMGYCHKIQKYI